MPSLVCGKCDKVSSKGGSSWESKNPSVKMCDCPSESAADDPAKEFAKGLQGGMVEGGMDEANKAALKVMAEEGSVAAVNYMMTDQETGCRRSYAEMRSLYG